MAAIQWIDAHAERALAGGLLAFIVLLISVNVVMRYVFNASLPWGEELTLWVFVWFIWLAVSYGFKQREHIRITILKDVLSRRGQLGLDLIIDLLTLVFMIALIIECVKLIQMPFVARQTSVVLQLPIPVLYASAPVGAALSSIRIIQHFLRTGRELRALSHGV